MPTWAKEYLLDGLSTLLCVRRNERETSDGRDERQMSFHSVGRSSYTGLNHMNNYNNHNNHNGGIENNHRKLSTSQKMEFGLGLPKVDDLGMNNMEALVQEVRVITSLINDQNRQDEIEEEWQSLAKIFDRLFFALFFIIFMTSSLVLLLPVYIDSLDV